MLRDGDPSDIDAILALFADWKEAVRARDLRRLAALVTEDAVFSAPDRPPVRGRDAVEDLYRQVFATFELDQDFELQEVRVLGTWAFVVGQDVARFDSRDRDGGSVSGKGMAISIVRREPDGQWRFARGINNMIRDPAVEVRLGG
ncbi:MAG TPA: SgcJ/EcaC family oxidoreductase [Thermoanaerobaculia bacterium]|nr:SgcJ/EcaC family oxidoreductase [Thermoanaerobaculia bacterium]